MRSKLVKILFVTVAAFVALCTQAATETVNGIEWEYTVTEEGTAVIGSRGSGLPAIDKYTTGAITIPSTLGGYPVAGIMGWAFNNCYSLTSVTIPNSVTSIGSYAFCNCYLLTSVTIPNSVTSIGGYAFYDCSSLESITIPDSVTSIGDCAFNGCDAGLYDTTTILGVTLVDGWAIDSDYSLSGKLDLTGVRGIGNNAFYGRSSLTSVTIPDSVTSIGYYAFRGCSSLTSVTIPDSVTSIGEAAFSRCNDLLYDRTIPDIKLVDGWVCGFDIEYEGVFSSRDLKLTGIRGIAAGAFSIEADDYWFANIETPKMLKSVTITGDGAHIGRYAFYGCNSLTNVTIGAGVASIGSSVFECCESLTHMTIGDDVTSIGSEAFSYCESLTHVTIGSSVTDIGMDAFYRCYSLESVIFKGNAPISESEVSEVFSYCTVLVMPDSTGWGVTIPGKWGGLDIKYVGFGVSDYALAGDVHDGTVSGTDTSVYDGLFYIDNILYGTIQAKVAKPKNGIAKMTTTIQITGEKKVSVKGELDVASGKLEAYAKDGRELKLNFGYDGMKGTFGDYEIDGARNFFSSKDKGDKADAENVLAPWLGALNMKCPEGVLSVTIAKKGKVTVKGTYDGAKVSAKAQALISEKMICIPVMYSKKSVNLAFTIWLPIGGNKAEIMGLNGAVIGKAGTLVDGAEFDIDGDIKELIPTAIEKIDGHKVLPNGETVSVSGTKWVVADGAKAAKVTYKKDVLDMAPGKRGDEVANASGLKLTYKSKDGSFTGSFTVYAIVKGKLKKHKATVEGVLINGIGYGTATIKKVGSWAIEIK